MLLLVLLLCSLGNLMQCAYTKEALYQLFFIISVKFESPSLINMLEFGDQVFYKDFPPYFEPFVKYGFSLEGKVPHFTPAKLLFEKAGMKHFSVDINGANGAMSYDARYDLTPYIQRQFNMITNLGFSEHVGEQDLEINLIKNQYAVWKNMHDLGEAGCVYYHHIPVARPGQWIKHGVASYHPDFFVELMRRNHYEPFISPTIIDKGFHADGRNTILTSFTKTRDAPFMSLVEFAALPGLKSKFEEYYIRDGSIDFLANTGSRSNQRTSKLVVDVRTQSLQDEVRKYCALQVLGFGLLEEQKLLQMCYEKLFVHMAAQRIDGLRDEGYDGTDPLIVSYN